MTPRVRMVQRFRFELGVVSILLGIVSFSQAADHGAVVSGVVRDAQGVPQMGAVVQILSANSVVRATAYTDLQGRYLVGSLLPGRYGVRASAVLLLPASRDNLRLQPDHRAVVDLTLGALFDATTWLPAKVKGAEEKSDDWNWTLRSSAGRPILKLAAEDQEAVGLSGAEGRPATSPVPIRARLTSSTKSFGDGATRVHLSAQKLRPDNGRLSLETSIASSQTGGSGDVPVDVSSSFERPLGLAGVIATRVNYSFHPEITGVAGGAGLRVVTISSAERFNIGDVAEVEAGERMQALTGAISASASRPFLKVIAHTGAGWIVSYNLATDPHAQDFDSMTHGEMDTPAAEDIEGRAETEKGLHQEITVSRQGKDSLLAIAYYADALDWVALSGGLAGDGTNINDSAKRSVPPLVGSSVSGEPGSLVDQSNGSFRTLSRGYRGTGFNVVLREALREGLWVSLQYSTGTALATSTPERILPQLQRRTDQTATVSAKANIARTATNVRASYRWQPGMLVTSVNPYDLLSGGDFLCLHLRQRLTLSGVLPEGVELTVDGNNMLGQGYRHFVGRNGQSLFLASSPASLRAGLAFSF